MRIATHWKAQLIGCAGSCTVNGIERFFYSPSWAREWVMQQGKPWSSMTLTEQMKRLFGKAVLAVCAVFDDRGVEEAR